MDLFFGFDRIIRITGGIMSKSKSNSILFRTAAKIAVIAAGNLLYAAGVVFFILPSGLITGGTTGIALIANHFGGIPVSAFVGIFNVVMFLLGMLVLGRSFALSTLVSTIAYPAMLGLLERTAGGFVLTDDKLLTIGAGRTKVEIISKEPEKLRSAILEKMDRGVTMLHARTGYLGIETDILYCIISPRELHRMETIIRSEDPEAFIVLSKASSVYGRGFSLEKNYI